MMYGALAKYRPVPGTVRGLLRYLGANQSEAEIVIQSVFLKIRETDADSTEAIVLLSIIQRSLGLPVSGLYDQKTAEVLTRLYGPNVLDASWLRLLEAISRQRQAHGRQPGVPAPRGAMGGLGDIWDNITSMFKPAAATAEPAPTAQQLNALQRVAQPAPVDQASPQWRLPGNMTVVPLNATTKAMFQELQRQANRFANTLGMAQINTDGTIGKDTIALTYKALSWANHNVPPAGGKIGDFAWLANKAQTSDLEWWAQNANLVASVLAGCANTLKLPSASGAFVRMQQDPALPPLQLPPAQPDNTLLYGALAVGAYFVFKKKGR